MSNFKPGDRVRVYSGGEAYTATVDDVCDLGILSVVDEIGIYYDVHPKQVRRLKPRQRRSITVLEYDNGSCAFYWTELDALKAQSLHDGKISVFIEKRRGSK